MTKEEIITLSNWLKPSDMVTLLQTDSWVEFMDEYSMLKFKYEENNRLFTDINLNKTNMISKQTKDFLEKSPDPIFKDISCNLPVEGKPLSISTPPGSDWDTDKILKAIHEQPMYVVNLH